MKFFRRVAFVLFGLLFFNAAAMAQTCPSGFTCTPLSTIVGNGTGLSLTGSGGSTALSGLTIGTTTGKAGDGGVLASVQTTANNAATSSGSNVTSAFWANMLAAANSNAYATATTFGVVKPGSNCTVTAGVLNCTGGGGAPGGSSGNVQFNNSGTFGGLPVGSGLTAGTSLATTALLCNGGSVITGTSYTIASTDASTDCRFTGSSGANFTLPAATTSGFGYGFSVGVVNDASTASITVTPASGTIRGAATLTIPAGTQCNLVSDGANYYADACSATSLASVVASSTLAGLNLTNSGTSSAQIIGTSEAPQTESTVGGVTFSAAEVLSGQLTRSGTQTAAFTDTLPTAAVLLAAYPNAFVGATFELKIYNKSATYVETIASNTNVTIQGNTYISPLSSSTFIGYISGIGASAAYTLTGDGPNGYAAYCVQGNSTSSNNASTCSSSPIVNRIVLSGSSSTASQTGISGCGSYCTGIGANGVFVAEDSASGHLIEHGSTPSCTSGCGTSPGTPVGTDDAGRITLGTSPSSPVIITFATAYGSSPVCIAQDETAGTVYGGTPSTGSYSFLGTFVSGHNLSWSCKGFF